jgi:hypothetical protein
MQLFASNTLKHSLHAEQETFYLFIYLLATAIGPMPGGSVT